MSRANNPRAKQQRRPEQPKRTGPAPPLGRRRSDDPRIALARRRARVAKAVIGTGGAIVFGAAMIFARHSYAGHPKTPATPLTAPGRFVSIVRENLLQAGILAPANAPTGAATAVS